MKVLVLNYEYPPIGGGAGNANKYILREMSRKGIEVDLVTSSAENYREETAFENVRVFRVDVGKKKMHHWRQIEILRYFWRGLCKSQTLIEENDYDIVHAWAGIPCGVMARLLGKEYLVALRGSDVPGYNSRFTWHYRILKPVLRSVWQSSEAVVPNSKGLRDLAKDTADMEMKVIPNGVDTENFSPQEANNENLKLLTVARLVERKRVQDIINALERVEAELVIVGEGPQKEALEKLAESKGVREKVEFKGRLEHSDLPSIYSSADVFVLPSLNEGMSNTVLEAMASGLPVIVTDTGGTEELVNENGFVVDKESPKQIADAVRKYSNDTDLLKKHSESSRSIAEDMSWENVASRYISIYRQIEDKA